MVTTLLLLFAALAFAGEYYAETESLTADSEAIDSMKMSEVRYHLKRLGIDGCPQCEDKKQFRDKLREALRDGKKVVVEEAKAGQAPNEKDTADLYAAMRKKKEENDRIREALRKAGYASDAFQTPEDKLADILGGRVPPTANKASGNNAKKTKKPKKAEAPAPEPPKAEEVTEDL